jgi:hypothetical protein
VVTTETERMKVKNELKDILEIQRGLAEMAVQLVASWTEEYRVRTAGDWRANLNGDVHLHDVLKRLDRTELDRLVAGMVKSRVERLETPFWNKWRDGQAAEIGALLGELERLGGERE